MAVKPIELMADEPPVVPLLRVFGCLLGSVQHGLHDDAAERLAQYILSEVEKMHPSAVILDFSVIPLVDSFLGRIIFQIHAAMRLMGTQLILVNMPNAVIITMVELGVTTPQILAARDIDAALALVGARDHAWHQRDTHLSD